MNSKSQNIGWNDWFEIHDPLGLVDISPYAFDRVMSYKDPQDVQDMFDEHGVEEAVRRINREYLIRHDRYALDLVKLKNITILQRADQ